MLPGAARGERPARPGLFFARMQLYGLRWVREQPASLALVLFALVALMIFVIRGELFAGCAPCPVAPLIPPGDTHSHAGFPVAAAASSEWSAGPTLARPAAAALAAASEESAAAVTMAHVVVGVMTCSRFHRTRCRAQSETWLRRARRVVFYSDTSEGTSVELQAPVVAHAFEPSAGDDGRSPERVFSGGNWRAVPILRSLAEEFFSERAQAAFRERGEPLPLWAFMVDDDSYAFIPQMLAALR